MLAAPPDGQGHAPFLQSGTEIFGAVDRVHNRNPACAGGVARNPAFFANEIQPRQRGCQQIAQLMFQKHIRFRHRAAIVFPSDLVAAFLQFRKEVDDPRLDPRQYGFSYVARIV